jgi:predicted kinase
MKILYIIRGLPGSGKTTLAQQLASYQNCHAADDFFVKDGAYYFYPEKLGEAHAACQAGVRNSMVAGAESICVHNTFTKAWEVAPYRALAQEFGYSVFVIECQNDFGNVHGVPDDTIEAMKARWEREV